MTARVLIVEDVPADVKLFEARLSAEYFDVITTTSGREAIDICERGACDVVLLDVMMPEMDGFEVCRRLKTNPSTLHIPVIIVTALDQTSDRIRGLEAGADDFLTKPVSGVALIARVRSLARLKMMTDELRMRSVTLQEIGLQNSTVEAAETGRNGRILVIDDCQATYKRIISMLAAEHKVDLQPDPNQALSQAADGNYDLLIISLEFKNFDGLRLCGQVRSLKGTRNVPILVLAEGEANTRLIRGLEIGVNDYLLRPIDMNELRARVRTQIRKKRYTERLSDTIESSVKMATMDTLTGLYNRRYMESHLATLVAQASSLGKPLTAIVIDIDFFKLINDTYGHDAGDDVLREFAMCLQNSTRGFDLVCRYGGEEFVILMPETDIAAATLVAERLRRRVATEPFSIQNGARVIELTISIGIATLDRSNRGSTDILKRADQALYRAKRDGRNRVVADAA
jgi:two-component system cell cycle response regulator